MKKISATDIVAFAIVELNVPIPLEDLYKMSPTDPLYTALMSAWKEKEKRADARTALLYEPSDFMPKEAKTVKDQELDIKSQFMRYMATQKSK